jgi:hypothetical protein
MFAAVDSANAWLWMLMNPGDDEPLRVDHRRAGVPRQIADFRDASRNADICDTPAALFHRAPIRCAR